MRHQLMRTSLLRSTLAQLRPRDNNNIKQLQPFRHLQTLKNMAATGTINISPENTGLWNIKQSDDAARKVTELLQKDYETHHVYFNDDGFHNHISHHILSLYGTGASVENIQRGYKNNEGYQRPVVKAHENPAETLRDWETAKKKLGKEQYYTDFLIFFEAEIKRLGGWEQTLQEYLFKENDERAFDMLVRMHCGFLHPIIQLMFGIEWAQPTMVAMALAQASVHNDRPYRQLFLDAEEAASKYQSSSGSSVPSVVSLYEAIRVDEKLAKSAKLSDSNKIRDGVMKRAPDEMMRVLAKVHVKPDEYQEKLAEMMDAAIYAGAAGAIREGKEPRWDFFLIHHINVIPIYIAMNRLDWIPQSAKVRLLEWKIRIDLVQYAARAAPELGVDRILSYTPKESKSDTEREMSARVQNMNDDDGHAIKLLRAVGVAKDFTKQYRDADHANLQFRDDAAYDTLFHLVTDAVVESGDGGRWVRGAGDPQAWKDVPSASAVSGRL